MDNAGDLFVVNNYNGVVSKIKYAQIPSVSFPTATVQGTTDTTDGTQTVFINNIGNEPLTLASITYGADFPEATGDSSACSTSLSAGAACVLPIDFLPESVGAPLSEAVTLTDNNLNGTAAQQSIPAAAQPRPPR